MHLKIKLINKNNKTYGLTLIEIAIVLVILGLLLGLGAGLISILTKRAKLIESRESVDSAVEALKGYAIRFGYLPQARSQNNYNSTVPDPAFNEVGVRGLDAHSKALLYIVAQELTNNSSNYCALNSTSLSIRDQGQDKKHIAFMIVSGSSNFNIQTNTTIYVQGSPNVDDFPYDFNRPEEYDDIVRYVSLFELQLLRCNYATNNYCDNMTITIENNCGNSYKINGGNCINNITAILHQGDYITIYSSTNCGGTIKGNYTYSKLLTFDSNKNCKISLGNQCDPQDI